MRKFLTMAAAGAVLAGPAVAQSPGGAARQPTPQALPQHQPAQSKPAQSDAERERVAREQGLSQAELYRRRESGLDEGQPLRR